MRRPRDIYRRELLAELVRSDMESALERLNVLSQIRLRALVEGRQAAPDLEHARDMIRDHGGEFFEAAEQGDAKRLRELLDQGFPASVRLPNTGATALHIAAAHGARDAIRVLMNARDRDLLVRDNKGRLPSELAGLFAHDPVLARFLLRKEAAQARVQNLRLTRKPTDTREPYYADFRSAVTEEPPTETA